MSATLSYPKIARAANDAVAAAAQGFKESLVRWDQMNEEDRRTSTNVVERMAEDPSYTPSYGNEANSALYLRVFVAVVDACLNRTIDSAVRARPAADPEEAPDGVAPGTAEE